MFCAIYWPRLCNPQLTAHPPPSRTPLFPYLVLVIVGAATKESTTAAAGLLLKEQKVPRLIASYFALFMVRTD